MNVSGFFNKLHMFLGHELKKRAKIPKDGQTEEMFVIEKMLENSYDTWCATCAINQTFQSHGNKFYIGSRSERHLFVDSPEEYLRAPTFLYSASFISFLFVSPHTTLLISMYIL